MDIIEAVKTRKSIRGFKKDSVPCEVLREILEISCRAPSGSNSQPWVYMHLQDMLDCYAYLDTPEHPLEMTVFRRKSLKTASARSAP